MRKELFEELLESVKQAKAIERGEMKPGRVFHVDPTNAVVNAKGQPLGRMVGLQSADVIMKTCKKRAPCCSDPNCKGCK